jgi:hypothetical protein
MPRREKINLEKVRASLFTLCTECGYKIPPAEERRIDFDHLRCPKCGAAFIPGKAIGEWSCEYDPHTYPKGCACPCGHVPDTCEYCHYIPLQRLPA